VSAELRCGALRRVTQSSKLRVKHGATTSDVMLLPVLLQDDDDLSVMDGAAGDLSLLLQLLLRS